MKLSIWWPTDIWQHHRGLAHSLSPTLPHLRWFSVCLMRPGQDDAIAKQWRSRCPSSHQVSTLVRSNVDPTTSSDDHPGAGVGSRGDDSGRANFVLLSRTSLCLNQNISKRITALREHSRSTEAMTTALLQTWAAQVTSNRLGELPERKYRSR